MHFLLKLTLKRLGLGLATLLALSILIFVAVNSLPDVAQKVLGQAATPEAVAQFRKELHLDEPALTRYFSWLWGIVAHGDFGNSLANGRSISSLISSRIGNTLFLAGFSALIAIPLAICLGLLTALLRNSWFDRTMNVVALTAISLPDFFIAYVLIFFLAQSGFLPAISNISDTTPFSERVIATILPAMTLTLVVVAHMMRLTRAAIINVLASPYIEMARLKGLPPWKIIIRHALPNALAPIINVVALNLAFLIVGVVVIEVVFVYPGLGQLMVDSVSKSDITVVQAVAMIFAATYITLNLVADLLVTLSNPRLIHRR